MPKIHTQKLYYATADTFGGLQHHLQRLSGLTFAVSDLYYLNQCKYFIY